MINPEKIAIIIVLVVFAIGVFETTISILIDAIVEKRIDTADWLTDGGPIRNIKYLDKNGNVVREIKELRPAYSYIYSDEIKIKKINKAKKQYSKKASEETKVKKEMSDREYVKKKMIEKGLAGVDTSKLKKQNNQWKFVDLKPKIESITIDLVVLFICFWKKLKKI